MTSLPGFESVSRHLVYFPSVHHLSVPCSKTPMHSDTEHSDSRCVQRWSYERVFIDAFGSWESPGESTARARHALITFDPCIYVLKLCVIHSVYSEDSQARYYCICGNQMRRLHDQYTESSSLFMLQYTHRSYTTLDQCKLI